MHRRPHCEATESRRRRMPECHASGVHCDRQVLAETLGGRRGLGVLLALVALLIGSHQVAAAPVLRVAVVQTVREGAPRSDRNPFVTWIEQAAAQGARVVVFPEGAIEGRENGAPAPPGSPLAAIRGAARAQQVYVVTGASGHDSQAGRSFNWMLVVGPDGRDVFRYDKLYEQHNAPMPGVFMIDGMPCHGIICADRWLRGIEEVPIQEGAQISFELSANFPTEWVPEFGWYWYVPRALRNNVWVVFANVGGRSAADPGSGPLGHGHSAIIAPDGTIVASRTDGAAGMIIADLDVAKATRAEARRRASHPVLQTFWAAGPTLRRGGKIDAPPLQTLNSPKVDVTLAAAPISGDLSAITKAIREARARRADVVAFPAGAVPEAAIEQLKNVARDNHITVVIGAEHRAEGGTWNSAFVLGPEGTLLTRYDQLTAAPPFHAGTDPAKMWFLVKGVPAIVTLGRDALWTELAECAAVAGARIVVHLDHDDDASAQARQRRQQVWVNQASFLTLTATVNTVDAALWDDLRGMEEISAEAKRRARPDTGAALVYSPWSANLVAQTTASAELLVATRTVPAGANPHHPLQTSRYNPQMEAWYRLGAAIVRGTLQAPPSLRSP